MLRFQGHTVCVNIQMDFCPLSMRDVLFQQQQKSSRGFAARCCTWLHELALGLEYLHGAGVIHGDLKPANVLLDAVGRIRIADFGLSRFVDGSAANGGAAFGTFPYNSPEQSATGLPSHPSDMYAYGMVIIEALTPFGTLMERAKVMNDVRDTQTIPPPAATGQVPPEVAATLRALARQCVSRAPSSRPTASEVVRQLACLVSETSGTAQLSAARITAGETLRLTASLVSACKPALIITYLGCHQARKDTRP